jgi:beta-glucosidase
MKEAVLQSIRAGLNVKTNFTKPEDFILPLRELVREGTLSQSILDARVRDVLRVKFKLGLFDQPYIKSAAATKELVNSAQHQQVALRAARESIVLLKNEGNTLPLGKQIKSIAVIGPNADDNSINRYRYGPSAVEGVTVLNGIRRLLGAGVKVNYARGCDAVNEHWPETEVLPEPLTKEERAQIDEAVEATRNSEIAIVVLGDSSRTVGESLSRTSLDLPGRQLELIQAVHAVGKPVVVVLLNGRPMSINWINRYVPAVVEGWFPGVHGGTAIAEVLFGDYNPGGKLTVTFPKTVGQIPFNFPTKPNAQWENEKSRVNGALYYFGHGLSYTTFTYSNLQISPRQQTVGGKISISVDVKNTGSRAGTEVVQLYTRDMVSSVTTYEKNLRGFERVELKPGETRSLKFVLASPDLALWDRNMRFVVEPGTFRVMIGSSSEDIRISGEFEIR